MYEQGDRNVRCFSQFKNSYGKVRAELGFFSSLLFFIISIVHINVNKLLNSDKKENATFE